MPALIVIDEGMGSLMVEKLPSCDGRTLVIGDVHGCLKELKQILNQFNPARGDRLIAVGDLINRGPDSRGTLDLARETGLRSVLGNHEKRLLKAWSNQDRGRLKWKDIETFRSLRKKDFEWMATWPHVFNIPSLRALVVHGGFVPGRKWRQQAASDVTFIQVVNHRGQPAKRSHDPNGRPWADFWEGKKHVFYGHTPREYPLLHRRATGLDTGCVYGFTLTAVSLPDFTFYKVPASKAYYKG